MCEIRDKFAADAWKKLVEVTEPTTDPEGCNLQPGTYTCKKFQVESSDINIPSVLFGTFRVKMEVYNGENELFFCTMVELECDQK
ncbi:unnamed protein product [Callosobruchus maculatus]|nr:unnamed protein product [Callosobruchus maculatus]